MTCATPSTAWCRRVRRVGAVAAPFFAFSAPAHAAPSPAATQALLSALALLALVVAVVAIAWARSAHRQMRAMREELQQTRAEAHALDDSLDVWSWRTDAQHRLIRLRPPAGATSQAWGANQSGPLLWEHFQADETSALKAMASSQAPLPLTAVRHVATGAEPLRLLLRGQAVLDAEGRFAGHVGVAREETSADEEAVAEGALSALVHGLPLPTLRIAPGASPQLREINPAAREWLGLARAQFAVPSWQDLLGRLPEVLRPAVAQAVSAAPVKPASHGGWTLHAQPWPGHADELMLLFHRVPVDAVLVEADYRDQESFSYTVSHDLRAPLRVVEGFTRIVKEDYGRLLDRIGNDHLDRVLGAAARMNNMIESLLALSRLSAQPISRQPVNLSQLVSYIVDDLRRQSPERNVSVQIEPGLQVQGDATLLRIALENLLGNAWKYTAKAATPQIWFERGEHEGRPTFTVRDNGAGFDMRFADRLFGVFQRLHSASEFQGTGVGLASVRRIVRRHGGDIWAEGEMNRGARFQFWLPQDTSLH
jgi:signal transduction histidine kinase